ncbi:MAG: hypothetical protein IKC69_02230, partial [Clostridia bacterium]|nr:hypothetical protein [Clostridia bacterium]
FYELFGFGKAYEDAYAAEKLDTLKDTLTKDELDAIKVGLIKEAVLNALANETEKDANNILVTGTTEKTATAYGKKVPVAFAETLMKVRTAIAAIAEENLSEYRAQMIKEVIDAALAEKDDEKAKSFIVITETSEKDADGKVTVNKSATIFEKTVPVTFAEAMNTFKGTLDSKASSALSSYVLDKINFVKDDEFSKWAFDTARKAGDTTVLLDGDGKVEEGKTLGSDKGYTYVEVYHLRTLPRKDEDKSRDVAYALFSSESNAKNAIAELTKKDKLDVAAFEEIIKANSATGNTTIEDCRKNQVGSTTFDSWLFDEELTVGAFTKEALKLDSSTWCVAYYTAEGEFNWKLTVTDTIMTEKQEAQYKDMETKYAAGVQTYDSAINKIKT